MTALCSWLAAYCRPQDTRLHTAYIYISIPTPVFIINPPLHSESIPLLPGKPPKKPAYRARPLWLVPFAIVASLVRGMTLAPRLEVYTQLACNNLYGHHEWNHTRHTTSNFSSDIANIPLYASIDPLGPHLHSYSLFPEPETTFVSNPNHRLVVNDDTDDTEDPRRIPSPRCVSDPAVQASAARLQTIMMTTMGLLSALTTGWWGHFSERHGRTRVLALSTLGLFLTDLMFILVSTPSSPFSKHGHKLLLISPIIEGLLGGYTTLQSGTSAYLSDCTSSGSRAYIFSRFAGVVYLGFSIGPVIGGWLISHPIAWLGGSSIPGRQSVTSVFWVALFCSFINLLLITFVFPESLDKEKKERAMIAYKKSGVLGGKKGKTRERALTLSSGDPSCSSADEEDNIEEVTRTRQEDGESGVRSGGAGIISHFLSPLAIFLPVMVLDHSGLGKRRDWSLTLLAGGLFGYMLSTGVFQIKYLYARRTYEWGAEQLSYYISFMGGLRAMFLLFLLPTLISLIKPKPLPPSVQKGKDRLPVLNSSSENGNNSKSNHSNMVQQPQPEQQQPLQNGKKPKPSRAQLGQEIGFDLFLTRFSLMIDIISQTLVIIFPAPAFTDDHISLMKTEQGQMNFAKSEALFLAASSLTSFGSGAVPAIHSLALCMLQVRALDAAACSADGEDAISVESEEGTGVLFGAFAVLQAVGQMILGPMIFGLVYSETVAKFPKAVFAVATALLVFALTTVLCVKNPVRPVYPGQLNGKKNRQRQDIERGRSRVSKDLRGGAIGIGNYGSTGSHDSGSSS